MKLKEDQGEVQAVVVVAAAAAVGTKAAVGEEKIGDAADAAVEEREDSAEKVRGIKKGRG